MQAPVANALQDKALGEKDAQTLYQEVSPVAVHAAYRKMDREQKLDFLCDLIGWPNRKYPIDLDPLPWPRPDSTIAAASELGDDSQTGNSLAAEEAPAAPKPSPESPRALPAEQNTPLTMTLPVRSRQQPLVQQELACPTMRTLRSRLEELSTTKEDAVHQQS